MQVKFRVCIISWNIIFPNELMELPAVNVSFLLDFYWWKYENSSSSRNIQYIIFKISSCIQLSCEIQCYCLLSA